jgi:hypothetical protein
MTKQEGIAFKIKLKEYCIKVLEDRLRTVELLIVRAQQSANEEGKSSAGDKYETSRAMGHLEKEMYQQQAANIRAELLLAGSVEADRHFTTVVKGSLVVVGEDLFIYVCVGIGKKKIDALNILFVSQDAPIFKLLQNKKPLDSFMLNRQSLFISEIW